MSTITTAPATTPSTPTRRARATGIGLWAARVVLAVQFVMGGVLKLTADPQMVEMFDDIGAGQWLRLMVGACELAGGVGVLVPRLARPAASGLAALMVGACVTNVVVLQISPAVPLTLLAVSVLVAAVRTRKGNQR